MSEPTRRFSWQDLRRSWLLILLVAMGGAVLAVTPSRMPLGEGEQIPGARTAGHLIAALAAGMIPLTALLLGWRILRSLGDWTGGRRERSLSLSLALGWGAMSHLAWLLGAFGSLTDVNPFSKWTGYVVFVLVVVIASPSATDLGSEISLRLRRSFGSRAGIHVNLLGLLVALAALRCLISALTPSFLYDVLEYHLPDARHLLETGSLRAIEGNAYSLMPQGVEALFALGRLFEGPATSFAPKLINFYLGLSTMAVLVTLLGQLGVSRAFRALGALVFLAHWSTFDLLRDAYADMATALYATAAIVCWVRARQEPNRLDPILAAVFLGLALSCKYPVAGVAAIPFFLVLVPRIPAAALPKCVAALRRPGRDVAGFVFLGAVLVAVYSPWLVRALAIDRSPFPPLILSTAHLGEDSPEYALRRFMAGAHKTDLLSLWHLKTFPARIPNLAGPDSLVFQEIWPGSRIGLGLSSAAIVWILATLLAFALYPKIDAVRSGLAWFVILGCFFWSSVPDSSPRFLAPLIPAAIALGITAIRDLGNVRRLYQRLAVLAILAWTAQSLVVQTLISIEDGSISAGLGRMPDRDFVAKHVGRPTADFFGAIEKECARKPNTGVLMLYEARVALVRGRVVSNTVFDRCPLWDLLVALEADTSAPGDERAVLARLRSRGIGLIAVNEYELMRLLQTYPAREAGDDPAFGAVLRQPHKGFHNPAVLAFFTRYYPPFYYAGLKGASESQIEKRLARLDRFLNLVRTRTVWETDLGGVKMWVARID